MKSFIYTFYGIVTLLGIAFLVMAFNTECSTGERAAAFTAGFLLTSYGVIALIEWGKD